MVIHKQKLFSEAFENNDKNSSYSSIKFQCVLKFCKFFFFLKGKDSNKIISNFSNLRQQ